MDNLKNHHNFLTLLYNTHLSQKKALIETSSLAQVEILCEIVLNILSGAADLNEISKDRFKRKKVYLQLLLQRAISKKRKQRIFLKNLKLLEHFLEIALNIIEKDDISSS